jgi:hypothetical protein
LGAFSLGNSLHRIADRLQPSNENLTERQVQTIQQIRTILEPWWPVEWCLLILEAINGANLVVSSVIAFRIHPTGRKLLLTGLLFAIVLDGLGLMWSIGAGVATFQVNLHHMVGSMEAATGRTAPLVAMRTSLIIGYIFGIAIILAKVGVEAAACKYLQSAAIRDLYRNDDERAAEHEG